MATIATPLAGRGGWHLRPASPPASRRSFGGVALLGSAVVHAAVFAAFGPFAASGPRLPAVPAGPLVVHVAIAPAPVAAPLPPVPREAAPAARAAASRPVKPAVPRAEPAPGFPPRERAQGPATVPPAPEPPAPVAGIGRATAVAAALASAPARVEPRPVLPPPVTPAAYLHTPEPAYPAAAREEGEEGVVTLSVRISPRGLPEEVVIENSSGFAALDRAALAGVRRWTFTPARRGDVPIEAWMRIPIRFRLG